MNLPLAPRRIGEGGRQLAELSQIPAAALSIDRREGWTGPPFISRGVARHDDCTALQLNYVCDTVRPQRTLLWERPDRMDCSADYPRMAI